MRCPTRVGMTTLKGYLETPSEDPTPRGESGSVRASASTSCTDATSTLRRKSIAQGRRGPCRGRAREEKLCAIGAFGAQVSQSEMIALDPPDHCQPQRRPLRLHAKATWYVHLPTACYYFSSPSLPAPDACASSNLWLCTHDSLCKLPLGYTLIQSFAEQSWIHQIAVPRLDLT